MRLTQFLLKKVNINIGELTEKFSNLPKSYIDRSMRQVYWRTPQGKPQYLPATVERKKYRFTTNRPWTHQFRQQNMPGLQRKKVFIEPVEKWTFFKGDRVEVLVGKDKGKQGIVKQIIQERNWVIVEGLNCHLRRIGKDKDYPGVLVKSEAPLLVTSQVALVDPSDLKGTPIEWRYNEEGEEVRVSLSTGRIIPIPKAADETYDFKSKAAYVEREKDTKNAAITRISFTPKNQTFEMEIMESMGIKEDGNPLKTFWY